MDPRPRRRPRLIHAPAALALALLGGCGGGGTGDPTPLPSGSPAAACQPVSGTPALTTQLVVSGFRSPVDAQVPAGDRARIFVVEQAGRIRIVRGGAIVGTPFLDVSARVSAGGERGLLGLAFHPRYAENGRFFVNYTDLSGDTHIVEFRASPPSSDTADPATERLLHFVRQPFANHNGGGLAFGNDGMLYIGLGDGGSAGDPLGNAQSLSTTLGKILRIDVDSVQPFGVPRDNPFASTPGAEPSIWAYGLRNPWRFGFDRATGDLYIGDVGQNAVEEIDVGLAARRGGENYGWNVTEGSRCFRPAANCSMSGLTLPVAEYTHSEGCSVSGGVVYRGCRLPGYHGTYFYGDFCTGLIRSFRLDAGRAVDQRDWTSALGRGVLRQVVSFGTDVDGEVLVLDYDGELYRVVPSS